MTDKPGERLNLVERMAKRLAAEAEAGSTSTAQPIAASFVERAAQKLGSAAPTSGLQGVPDGNRYVPQESAAFSLQPSTTPTIRRESVTSTGGASSSVKQVQLDFRALRQNGMITPDNMSSAISNEFRGIKRRLLQKVRDPKTRAAVNNIIMITSSLPGEGKTFSSINLAMSLAAEKGLQVLLIDADIIRPSVANVFASPPRVGLTELLSGKTGGVSEVLHRCTDIPSLSVIFSGSPKNGNPELISSSQMVNLCRELSSRYPDRVILIDTPPVLASSEAAILASYVHQIIMVVAADQTDKHQLRKSLEAVSSCQHVSLLFNKAPDWNEAEYTPYYGYAGTQDSPATTPPQA